MHCRITPGTGVLLLYYTGYWCIIVVLHRVLVYYCCITTDVLYIDIQLLTGNEGIWFVGQNVAQGLNSCFVIPITTNTTNHIAWTPVVDIYSVIIKVKVSGSRHPPPLTHLLYIYKASYIQCIHHVLTVCVVYVYIMNTCACLYHNTGHLDIIINTSEQATYNSSESDREKATLIP